MTNNKRLLNEDGSAWVLFRPSGYPYKLRRQLRDAKDDEAVLGLLLPYIVGIHLPTVDGMEITKLNVVDDLADVDESISYQLVIQFFEFRGERNTSPVPKNSSLPSQST